MRFILLAVIILSLLSCSENKQKFAIYYSSTPELLAKNEAFLILNSQLDKELINLIKNAKIAIKR